MIDKVSGEFIGWIGLKFEMVVCLEYFYYDFGYCFCKVYWGKGIVIEIVFVLFVYGFYNL